MSARTRLILGAITVLLVFAGVTVIGSQPLRAHATKVMAVPASDVPPPTIPPTTTPTTSAPVPTTTTALPTPVVERRAPMTTQTTAAATQTAPVVRQSSSRETCQFGWDATRIDDGSLDEVVIMLNAPRRANEAVTITAAPHGPTTAPTVRLLTTDGSGQVSTTVRLSEDKRDWTVTVSALFVSGGGCPAQTFAISYN